MDDIVKQAIAKWPDVPAVYGWLELDRRGNWLIQNDRVTNPQVADFIGRNYERDSAGCWFFQNGPQRVFAALQYTPLVYRVAWNPQSGAPLRIQAHTGAAASVLKSAWVDDAGIILLDTELGIGMMDDRDLASMVPCFTGERGGTLTEDALAQAIERLQTAGSAPLFLRYGDGVAQVRGVAAADVPAKFGFVQRPVQPAGEDACR